MDNENKTSEELSVQIYTDFKTALPDTIKWNYDNLKKSLEESLAPLHGLVLSKDAEGIKFAKGKRAAINKMMNLILDARVETKKKYLAPFEDFEQKANALITMCRTASGEFDSFVKNCEIEIKNAKKVRIHEYLAHAVKTAFGEHSECFNSQFWGFYENSSPRWLNATYKDTDIHAEIDAKVADCKKAYEGVLVFFEHDAELKEKALIEVVKDFDLNRVITEINRYKEERERIQKAAEAARVAKEKSEELSRVERERMEKAKAELAASREAAKNTSKSGRTESSVAVSPQQSESEEYVFNLCFNGDGESMGELLKQIIALGISTDKCTMRLKADIVKFRQFRSWLNNSNISFNKVEE